MLFKNKLVRFTTTAVLAVAVLTALPGCSDEQISDAALIIGAVAIGVAAGTGNLDQPSRHDHGGWDRGSDRGPDRGPDRGSDHGPDRGPGPDRGGGGGRGPGPGPHSPSAFSAAVNTKINATVLDAKISALKVPAFKSTDKRVLQLAHNYDISDYAATYVVRAIVLAQAKDTSGVKALGLDVKDFKRIFDGRPLESDKISSLGTKLKMNTAATEQLVEDMSKDIQVEKAARGL